MEFRALALTCPGCGSDDVAYSCSPDCCFNHVCGACLNSFELFTADTGDTLGPASIDLGEKGSCEPTVECARCGGLNVCHVKDGAELMDGLVCATCHALLQLRYS